MMALALIPTATGQAEKFGYAMMLSLQAPCRLMLLFPAGGPHLLRQSKHGKLLVVPAQVQDHAATAYIKQPSSTSCASSFSLHLHIHVQ